MNKAIKTSSIKSTIIFVVGVLVLTLALTSSFKANTQKAVPTQTPTKPTGKSASKDLPDLRITEMKLDKADCAVYVRVVNKGFKDAGTFRVWADFGVHGVRRVETSDGLARNKDVWMRVYARKPQAFKDQACYMDQVTSVSAAVDPRYMYFGSSPTWGDIQGLLQPGKNPPFNDTSVKIAEPQVEETDENNNQLTVKIADMKPYP
jgi:hypothetical protein